jgi:CheY-like chemotaxis protein
MCTMAERLSSNAGVASLRRQRPNEVPASGTRVLLVSPSRDEREMYAEFLRSEGFCTLQASSAADGYRLACELLPDIIVTELRLAYEDGLQLIRRLRRVDRLRGVPAVVLSASVLDCSDETAARAGCDRFVVKPCLPTTLHDVIERLLHVAARSERRSA